MLIALFAPWLAPHDPNWQDAAARLQAPSRQHWLGTDSYGRDLLSRLIYGSRPALGLVALVTIITLPVGLLIGILAGYYGGWLERVLMRFTDVVMSMPRLILAFAFVAMLGPGLVNGALALALTTGLLMRVRHGVRSNVCDTVIILPPQNDGHPRQASAGWSYFAIVPAICHCPSGAGFSGYHSGGCWRVFLGLVLARQWRNGEP